MNRAEVKRLDRYGVTVLLYSHDDGFTRHVVEIQGSRYIARLNEVHCFKRRTHEDMARIHGFNLNTMKPAKS